MTALLLTYLIFFSFCLLGYAALSLFPPRLRLLQSVLISPAIGMAISLLPVYLLNRAGFPVNVFGQKLAIGLILASFLILFIKKPGFPLRKIGPYFIIVAIGILLCARPMYLYGFDWISFVNDDMTNYCLGAQRFFYFPYEAPFDKETYYSGLDYSQAFWFMHINGHSRPGSELLLALIWSLTGVDAFQLFMPVIVAVHGCLIMATGALVCGFGTRERNARIAMILASISPLLALGTLYQLIAQVGGLALLISSMILLYRPHFSIAGLMSLGALILWYPEVLPFFGLGWLIHFFFTFKSDPKKAISLLIISITIGILVCLLLYAHIWDTVLYLIKQSTTGLSASEKSAVGFPFYLIPSGIPALWGLIPIGKVIPEPLLSVSILAGIGLSVYLIIILIPRYITQQTCQMLAIMTVLGFVLYYRVNDFGLFKLAMYLQPFLAGTLATWIGQQKKSSRTQTIVISFCLLPLLMSQQNYVKKSTGEYNDGFNEIYRASSMHLLTSMSKLRDELKNDNKSTILSMTTSVIQAKMQGFYLRGFKTHFPSQNFFSNLLTLNELAFFKIQTLENNAFKKMIIEENVNGNTYLISNTQSEIFNRSHAENSLAKEIFLFDNNLSNYLLFTHSNLGKHYYTPYYTANKISTTSFYQIENDPLFPGKQFSLLGRYLLFQGINPSPNSRMVFELTNTVVKQLQSTLPNPTVQGQTIPFVGRGSGRIYSSPLTPTLIEGESFYSVDMNREPAPYPHKVKYLMRLYGAEIPSDRRLVTTYGRDISLVSDEYYQNLQRPSIPTKFPDDLGNLSLEYSGIYEDGWSSEESFFRLSPDENTNQLMLKLMIPLIDNPGFTTEITVKMNEEIRYSETHGIGEVEIALPITDRTANQKISITYSKAQTLPGEDGRLTGGLIKTIGFTP